MNMNAKKRVNGSWVNTTLRQYKTATDTITTFPAVLYTTGTTATVVLKGQTVRSGKPSPDNPIMPEGCGDLETVGTKAGQYKIPISSAEQTTPLYLGEVETTRNIYKLVLTGQEVWYDDALPKGDTFSYRMTAPYIYDVGNTVGYDAICSHFQVGAYYAASIVGIQHSSRNLYFRNTETTLENWKQWLADQYSNGTPVKVWYRLATPTTGVVNEPLMKIGDYADEVSNISIPTITGKNIVDVETVPKPSEVSFNYAGWHNAVVHKRINGAWD